MKKELITPENIKKFFIYLDKHSKFNFVESYINNDFDYIFVKATSNTNYINSKFYSFNMFEYVISCNCVTFTIKFTDFLNDFNYHKKQLTHEI